MLKLCFNICYYKSYSTFKSLLFTPIYIIDDKKSFCVLTNSSSV